jgi:hypothetical protein
MPILRDGLIDDWLNDDDEEEEDEDEDEPPCNLYPIVPINI